MDFKALKGIFFLKSYCYKKKKWAPLGVNLFGPNSNKQTKSTKKKKKKYRATGKNPNTDKLFHDIKE